MMAVIGNRVRNRPMEMQPVSPTCSPTEFEGWASAHGEGELQRAEVQEYGIFLIAGQVGKLGIGR
jgi:hypothetical protein